jgi:hypothetical protein
MSNVKEAAERLRVVAANPDASAWEHDGLKFGPAKRLDDMFTVVDAYLALVPADDGEPIDEAFAVSLGMTKRGHFEYQKTYVFADMKRRQNNGNGQVWLDAHARPGPKCWEWGLFNLATTYLAHQGESEC